MRKYVVLMFALLLQIQICFGQCGWVCTFPKPAHTDLYSVAVIDYSTAVIVGRLGTIILTTDSGENWTSILTCSQDELNAVQFVNQNTGFVGGTDVMTSNGIIYRTTNQGVDWSRIIVSENFKIKSICFLNSNTGFAATGSSNLSYILHTTNGGLSWVPITIPINLSITAVYFADFQNGYVAGNFGSSGYAMRVLKTTDGGNNWSVIASSDSKTVSSMYFKNATTGYYFGRSGTVPSLYSPYLLRTTNGGLTWTIPSGPSRYIYSMYFTTPDSGYAAGYSTIMKTINNGNNWIEISTNPVGSNYSIHFADINTGYSVGYNASILKTTNSGQNWSQLTRTPAESFMYRIIFDDMNTGYAVCDEYILRTSDSGNNWSIVYTTISQARLIDISVANKDTIFACGNGIVLKSIDQGSNWTNISPSNNITYYSISFQNTLTGYCSGPGNSSGYIYKTINGGLNWNALNVNFSPYSSGSIDIIDSNIVYVCGYTDIMKTTNGGINWYLTGRPATLHCIFFHDANTGFAGGYNKRIFKTTDGGSTWNIKFGSSSNTPYINSISFSGTGNGIAVSDDGDILKTRNDGENWSYITSPTDRELLSVFLTDSNTIFLGGGYGATIFKTTTGGSPIGMSNSDYILPLNFSLSQNYPNPFNPQTKIKFDVSKTALTKLIVYDILGREVVTLVNEELKPGAYSFDWDGSNYASGIYFYRLIAGDFAETKKMVLMK